jgi:NAD(P)-dependent dehydrogenase (short-subunit alcohol dehydrogenase family)
MRLRFTCPGMPLRFEGRVAIVTGAGSGIGRAIATALSREGASVAVADIDESSANETLGQLAASGRDAFAVKVDVANATSVAAMTDAVLGKLGKIDILVNSAGIASRYAAIDLPEAEWDRVLATNLKGVFLCSQSGARAMIARGAGGAIVNISSVAAAVPTYEAAHYGASKAGINQLTKSLAVGLARHKIRVNAVQPGTVLTPMNERDLADPNVMAERVRLIPLGRVGRPEDVAAATLFLASDEASWITGVSLPVDGGNVLMR